jgi:hypothetical protein
LNEWTSTTLVFASGLKAVFMLSSHCKAVAGAGAGAGLGAGASSLPPQPDRAASAATELASSIASVKAQRQSRGPAILEFVMEVSSGGWHEVECMSASQCRTRRQSANQE